MSTFVIRITSDDHGKAAAFAVEDVVVTSGNEEEVKELLGEHVFNAIADIISEDE